MPALKRFLADHPSGHFAAQARERIRVLDAAALPPPPGADPGLALATMVRFDGVVQMGPTVPPLPNLSTASGSALTGAPTASAAPAASRAVAAPPSAPAQADTAVRPTPPPQAPPAEVRVASSPPPAAVVIAAPLEPANVLDRPQMIAFDMPVLPTAFCDAVDRNSYLTDFHKPLDRAAQANNDAAIAHMTRLNARFTELVKDESGTDAFVQVAKEVVAYKAEADLRFKTALAVNDLDRQIRLLPIQAGGACAHSPWPSPVHGGS